MTTNINDICIDNLKLIFEYADVWKFFSIYRSVCRKWRKIIPEEEWNEWSVISVYSLYHPDLDKETLNINIFKSALRHGLTQIFEIFINNSISSSTYYTYRKCILEHVVEKRDMKLIERFKPDLYTMNGHEQIIKYKAWEFIPFFFICHNNFLEYWNRYRYEIPNLTWLFKDRKLHLTITSEGSKLKIIGIFNTEYELEFTNQDLDLLMKHKLLHNPFINL